MMALSKIIELLKGTLDVNVTNSELNVSAISQSAPTEDLVVKGTHKDYTIYVNNNIPGIRVKEAIMTHGRVVASSRQSDLIISSNINLETERSLDQGETWQKISDTRDAVFITQNDTLLRWHNKDINTSYRKDLYRSTDKGDTWTLVKENIEGYYGTNQGICEHRDGTIVFAEYPTPDDLAPTDEIRVWRSIDDGQHWTSVLSVPRSSIRHFHTAYVDPFSENILVTSGDRADESHWYLSEDKGATFSQIAGSGTELVSKDFTTLGILFTDDNYVWGQDAIPYANVIRASKNSLDDRKRLLSLPQFSYGCLQVDPIWFIITNARADYQLGHLFASNDQGNTWYELLKWPGEGLTSIFGPDYRGWYYVLLGHTGRGTVLFNQTLKFRF